MALAMRYMKVCMDGETILLATRSLGARMEANKNYTCVAPVGWRTVSRAFHQGLLNASSCSKSRGIQWRDNEKCLLHPPLPPMGSLPFQAHNFGYAQCHDGVVGDVPRGVSVPTDVDDGGDDAWASCIASHNQMEKASRR